MMRSPFLPVSDRWRPRKSTEETLFATIAAVYSDGATLYIRGDPNPTQKHYRSSKNLALKAGDRVKVIKTSGTYVIDYVIGIPVKE